MSKTVDSFVNDFEDKFGKYLQPAKLLEVWDGNTISYSKYFSIIHAKNKFSDWDLECYVKEENFDIGVLGEMYEYIHDFDKFRNTCDFIGNKWFQFMAFLPEETTAPFIDIHILGIDDKLIDGYFQKILNIQEANQQTKDWLVITWFRKVKNNNRSVSKFRDFWLKRYLTSDQYDQVVNDPDKFFYQYLLNPTYTQLSEFFK